VAAAAAAAAVAAAAMADGERPDRGERWVSDWGSTYTTWRLFGAK
jgi:hypothetical protein